MPRSVAFVIEGPETTQVRVTANLDGTLSFEFTRLGAGRIADLVAVFLDLNRPLESGGFRIYGDAGLTEGPCVEEGVDMLGRKARITRTVVDALGDFDIGIVFGALACDRRSLRRTGFTLAHETSALTLDMLDLADFGLRFARPGAEANDLRGPRTPRGGERGTAGRDALEVIEIQGACASLLARDTDGGVLAVIDLQGARDAHAGAGTGGEHRAGNQAEVQAGSPVAGRGPGGAFGPGSPPGREGLHPVP